MKTIFIVMRIVDLGGHPVIAYSDSVMAESDSREREEQYKIQKIKELMEGGRHTKEMAEEWIANCDNQFYIEEVEYS